VTACGLNRTKSELEALLRTQRWRVRSALFGRCARCDWSFASENRTSVIEVLLRVGSHSVDVRSLERDVMRAASIPRRRRSCTRRDHTIGPSRIPRCSSASHPARRTSRRRRSCILREHRFPLEPPWPSHECDPRLGSIQESRRANSVDATPCSRFVTSYHLVSPRHGALRAPSKKKGTQPIC
jgi:hypothetical protein